MLSALRAVPTKLTGVARSLPTDKSVAILTDPSGTEDEDCQSLNRLLF